VYFAEGRRTLSAEELSGDVEGFAAHNNDLLALEKLLSDGGGQATEEVALAIDGDLFVSFVSKLILSASKIPKPSTHKPCGCAVRSRIARRKRRR
jgi:hypothetical protein